MDEVINKIFKLIGNTNPNKPISFRDSGKYEHTISQIGKDLEKNPPNLEGISQYQKDFQKEADSLLEEIKILSKKESLSFDYILKNTIACGPDGSTVLYKYWTTKEMEIPSSPKTEMLQWLLGLSSPPSLLLASKSFYSTEAILWSKIESLPKRILAYQEYILKKGSPWILNDTKEVLQAILQTLGRIDIPKERFGSRIKLPEREFKQLAPYVRQWILKSKEDSNTLLEKSLNQAIWANPLKYKDTPQAIKAKKEKQERLYVKSLLKKVIKSVETRNLEDHNLMVFLNSKYSHQYQKRIIHAFKINKPEPSKTKEWFKSKLTKDIPQNCSKFWNKENNKILEFYSKNIGDRVVYVSHLNEKDLRDFTKRLCPLDIYACFRYNSLDKRNKSLFQYLRPKIHVLYEKKEFQNWLLNGLPVNPKDTPISRINHLWNDQLWNNLKSKDLVKFIERFPTLLEKLKPRHFESLGVKSFLTKALKNPEGLEKFIRGLNEKDIQEIQSLSEERKDWLKNIIFKTSPISKAANKKLAKLIIASPWLLPKNLKTSTELYKELYNKSSEKEDYLVKLRNKKGKFHFKSYLTNNQKKTDEILNLVKIYNKEELENTEVLYASKLWEDKTFGAKLRQYLNGDLDFRHLKVSKGVLRALIPYVYKEAKDRPLIASAYTLAMAYSPWNLKFIVGLAIKILKDKNYTQGQLLDSLYTIKLIPKRRGGLRELHIPNDELKQIQRNLIDYGFYNIPLAPCVQGFSPKTSILSNASPHTKKELVANIDIDSFFSSCDYKKILKACSHLIDKKYCPYGAKLLAELCSYKSFLPTGSPTSPVLGNLILSKADKAISTASNNWGITYTRYADDLTFSGSDNTLQILPFVKKILEDLGFKIKEGKTNVFRRGRRQMVTGLVVNETAHVPRAIRRKIRAATHNWKINGRANWKGKAINKKQLKGRIAFLKQVHKKEATKLKENL